MGLTSILTDRARLIAREQQAGEVVEGTRVYAEAEPTEWFKARLFPEEAEEQEGVRGGRRTITKAPHVLVGRRDVAGQPIPVGEIGPGKLIEVNSRAYGTQRWQITSDPQPLVPKRRVLGHYFTVRRVEVA